MTYEHFPIRTPKFKTVYGFCLEPNNRCKTLGMRMFEFGWSIGNLIDLNDE